MKVENESANTSDSKPLRLVKEYNIEDFASRIDFRRIWRGVLRRVWLIILVAVSTTALFSLLSHHLSKGFIADAYLMYEMDSSKLLPNGFPLAHFTISSATEVITLPENLNAVRSILGLEYTGKQLEKMVTVTPPAGDSNLLDIQVIADTPNVAMDIANTLAQVVVKNAQEFAKKQLKVAYDYFRQQADQLRDKINADSKEIAAFRSKNKFLELSPEGSLSIKGLLDLQTRLSQANENFNGSLIEYENLRREASKLPDKVSRASLEDSPAQRMLSQAELSLMDARTRYASENPKIKVLEAQVEELRKIVANPPEAVPGQQPNSMSQPMDNNPFKDQVNAALMTLRGRVRSAQKLRDDIALEYADKQKEMSNLPEVQMVLSRLMSEKQRDEDNLKEAEQFVKAAETLMKVGKGDLELYMTANKATPNESLLFELLPLVGFFLGILAGATLAATLEIFDTRLRTPTEVNNNYNIPCILSVPELKLYMKDRDVMENQLRFFIRTLEEAIEKGAGHPDRFVLGVASSQNEEGKSLFAYFLARFYQKLGKSTIVVEFDNRPNPFFESHEVGKCKIEQYLRGQCSFDDLVYTGQPSRITCGKDIDMKELVKTPKMRELLNILRERFQVVIIDLPGMVIEDYAINVLALADQSIYLISSSKTTRKYVNDSLKDLEFHHIKPIGIVLNRILNIFVDDVRVRTEGRRAKYGAWAKLKNLFMKKPPKDQRTDLQPKT